MNTGISEYGMTGKTNKVVPGDRVNGQTTNLEFGSASLHLSLNRVKHLTQGEQNDSKLMVFVILCARGVNRFKGKAEVSKGSQSA